MRFFLIFFFEVVQCQVEVGGYIGGSVTLPASVDPSWRLFSTKWSIYTNDTLITKCRNGTTNSDRFYLFRGRLRLDCTTGDLKIFNLSTNDALLYTVELTNTERLSVDHKIKLNLKQRLRKPTTKTLFSVPTDGGFWTGLSCESQDAGVDLLWNVNPEHRISFPQQHPDRNQSVIFTFLNDTQNGVEFTCTSSRDGQRTDDVVVWRCPVAGNSTTQIQEGRGRFGLILAAAFFAGPTLLFFIKYFIERHQTSRR